LTATAVCGCFRLASGAGCRPPARRGDQQAQPRVLLFMARSILVLAALIALTAPLVALSPGQDRAVKPLAIGDMFPRLEGDFLTGRRAVLPDGSKGKLALVMMGFTYDSRHAVEAWAARVRPEIAALPQVTWFEVPVIGGMGRLASWFIDSGMRKGTPKDLHENVITVYGGGDRWKSYMGFTSAAADDAYLTLIDRDGRVLWLHHGAVTSDAAAALKTIIEANIASGS
jgi:hypothetical protein